MSILARWKAWLDHKRAQKELIEAERVRNRTAKWQAYRIEHNLEHKYLDGIKREATNRSLRASCILAGRPVVRRGA